jgi:uncharacterized protein (DUF1778 family)
MPNSETIKLKVKASAEQCRIIDSAARRAGISRSRFVPEAACRKAQTFWHEDALTRSWGMSASEIDELLNNPAPTR